MSDYERYGDYNDIEDDEPGKRSPVMLILKIITAVVCIGVVGIIAYRMITFNRYPDSMENVYFNETLTEYYNANGGDISVKTQVLRAPYSDNKVGNFFCDYLYVIDEIDQLQITVRYNKATVTRIADELGISLDDKDPDIFTYRLCASYGDEEAVIYDTVSYSEFTESAMYRYNKLVFDGVEMSLDGGVPYWIRLEVIVEGKDEPYMIPIFENHESYNRFTDVEVN